MTAAVVFCACQAALGVAAADAAPMTIVVSPGGGDSAAVCSRSPCPNIRSAVMLADAHPGSTVALERGAYDLTLAELPIMANMTVVGKGPLVSKVRQLGTGRVFDISGSGTVTLADLEATGGNVTEIAGDDAVGGGVLSVSSGALTLRHVRVDDNTVQGGPGVIGGGLGGQGDGAGVFVGDGALLLDHTTVDDNTAAGGNGGGGLTGPGGPGGPVFGAGVYSLGTGITVQDSAIVANVGVGGEGGDANILGGAGGVVKGGGIDAAGTTSALITRTTVAENLALGGSGGDAQSLGGNGGDASSGFGGGLLMREGKLVDSTVTGNRASTGAVGSGLGFNGSGETPLGGGVDVVPGPGVRLASDTFAHNIASQVDAGNGGNIAANVGARAILSDSIVAGGSAANGPNCSGRIVDGGYNLENSPTSECDLSAAKHDLIAVNPNLAPLANNGGPTQTMALRVRSRAIDAGPAVGCPASDQRGKPRPDKGERRCDIGAYEFQDAPRRPRR